MRRRRRRKKKDEVKDEAKGCFSSIHYYFVLVVEEEERLMTKRVASFLHLQVAFSLQINHSLLVLFHVKPSESLSSHLVLLAAAVFGGDFVDDLPFQMQVEEKVPVVLEKKTKKMKKDVWIHNRQAKMMMTMMMVIMKKKRRRRRRRRIRLSQTRPERLFRALPRAHRWRLLRELEPLRGGATFLLQHLVLSEEQALGELVEGIAEKRPARMPLLSRN